MLTQRLRSSLWFTNGLIAALLVVAVFIGVRVGAAPGDDESVFVPITPCRLFDTRPAPDNVGTRNQPFPAATSTTMQVTGANGECNLPTNATAIALNVTIVNPTKSSFLQMFPADSVKPSRGSNLNWVAHQAPTPNKVDVKLSSTGAVKIYNNAGTVDALADVVGYYTPINQRTQIRSINIPAASLLNDLFDDTVEPNSVGMAFDFAGTDAGLTSMYRPTDWVGDTQVTVRVAFGPTSEDTGNTRFELQAFGYDVDVPYPFLPTFDEEIEYIGPLTVDGTSEFVFTVPAAALQNGLWDFYLTRVDTDGEEYFDRITVFAITLEYLANA